MDFTEINSRGKRGELLERIDRQNSRFRTAKTAIIKFCLHASFVELESAKSALNECPFNSRLVCWKSSWPITTLSGYKIRTNYIGQAAWWSYQELEIRRQENDFFILPLLCVASPSQVLDCICASVGQLWSEEKYGLVELKERDNIMALI
ncbi:hypothetical protein TNCV_2871611 [Trichonephila clavipes]|nr:hypothetical protein TNCV_2871611 [Trichonephila clavipes]